MTNDSEKEKKGLSVNDPKKIKIKIKIKIKKKEEKTKKNEMWRWRERLECCPIFFRLILSGAPITTFLARPCSRWMRMISLQLQVTPKVPTTHTKIFLGAFDQPAIRTPTAFRDKKKSERMGDGGKSTCRLQAIPDLYAWKERGL